MQVRDAAFAARVRGKLDRCLEFVLEPRMVVRVVPVEMKYEKVSVAEADEMAIKRHLLEDRYARLKMKECPESPDSECAVCLTEAEDPFCTPCGHC